ncbi:diadenylate cyclase [Cetobacterium ceti]|uniref:Diadenylate cyclase n=1 Tax=Cetobacterium ceti TaxID=180163 RepID=A0A1T4KZP9_9FUSO|nr:DNA integrity scanning diadenylate cyclase DisA [Cetobacterium ceti]SJZ47942.1 diadenylate cyclase [Cetobacterium ceti]
MNKKELLNILSQVTPGTELREGIYNILDAGLGALIVVGVGEDILKIIDGGFKIDCEYTPERIYELAKMDGAIIIDETVNMIYYANVHLQPSVEYTTSESGTRHRTAQRVAKQTNNLVIAISERKKSVSLYKGDMRYRLRDTSDVMAEASQALKTLERYRYVLDKSLGNLTILELDDLVTMYEVTSVLQRFEMVKRIMKELDNYVIELGTEGRLINLQLEELIQGVQEEKYYFLKDYCNSDDLEIGNIIGELEKLSDSELLELERLSFILGYGKTYSALDNRVSPKGYRVLDKISKLTKKDIEKLISIYGDLSTIQVTPMDELVEIKGISKFKVKAIQSGLMRLKLTVELEK